MDSTLRSRVGSNRRDSLESDDDADSRFRGRDGLGKRAFLVANTFRVRDVLDVPDEVRCNTVRILQEALMAVLWHAPTIIVGATCQLSNCSCSRLGSQQLTVSTTL